MASFDILLATFTANAVVLASLLQDRGYKKSKFKQHSVDRGRERHSSLIAAKSLTSIVGGRQKWGSNEDLIRGGDKRDMMIRMEILKGARSFNERRELEKPDKAKLQEIRVDSMWEVHVDKRISGKDDFS